VLGVLLNIVGSTLIVTWVATLVSQIVLRRRAEAAGSALPLRMWGYPWLSYATLAGIAVIIGLGLTVESVRFQIVGTLLFVVALYVVGLVVPGAIGPPQSESAAARPGRLRRRVRPGRARRSAHEEPASSPLPPTRRACPGSVLCGGRSDDRRRS